MFKLSTTSTLPVLFFDFQAVVRFVFYLFKQLPVLFFTFQPFVRFVFYFSSSCPFCFFTFQTVVCYLGNGGRFVDAAQLSITETAALLIDK